tara:strand:- start:2972 stop:3154 length:183 start_codon:yes stop_codon:yes gene_type:complete
MKVIMGKTAISLKLWSVNVWKATTKALRASYKGYCIIPCMKLTKNNMLFVALNINGGLDA